MVTGGPEKLRAAEKAAKEKKLRIWKNYVPSAATVSTKDKQFGGKVVEIVNADAMVLKLGDGSFKKIFLASIRPPRSASSSVGRTTTTSLLQHRWCFVFVCFFVFFCVFCVQAGRRQGEVGRGRRQEDVQAALRRAVDV